MRGACFVYSYTKNADLYKLFFHTVEEIITKCTRHWRGLNSSSLLESIARHYSLTKQQKYLDFAKEVNVKIATENMWNWDYEKGHSSFAACATPKSFCDHVDAINDEFFVACLDIGHAEMKGSDTNAPEMVRALGYKRLKALHIHDIDGINDNHQIPFSLNINFDAVTKALKEIGYDGYYTLESN